MHALVYKVLFEIVGREPYWPYRVAAVTVHLTCVGLIYRSRDTGCLPGGRWD